MAVRLESSAQSLEVERTKQIFRFLKAFAERNMPVRRTLGEQLWHYRLADLPTHPSISVMEVRLEGAGDETPGSAVGEAEPLIRVRRPRLTAPPPVPSELVEWLTPEWQSAHGALQPIRARNVRRGMETVTEAFDDSEPRRNALAAYRGVWDKWAEAEKPAVDAMRVFERLYELRGRIERESERVELMMGDGRLRWLRADGGVDHPVLLQRVELEFDADVPEFRVIDADRAPELYGIVLQGTNGISAVNLNQLRQELESGGYHPLARSATDAFLRRLAQQLGPRGKFSAEETRTERATTDPLISRDPVLFLRERLSGFPAAFDRVLEDLESGASVPVSLTRLVGVTPAEAAERVRSEASPWGEPLDVLLSKPANPEQIAIARALDHHRAILVQGPPGTGKSHTIANLIGHLVAQGKRVLVTSHTTKALRVLRDQVVEPLRPLCVAVLDNDTEARAQMEQAVRGILQRLTSAREEALERELADLAQSRAELNGEITKLTADLRTVRESEYRPILLAGESLAPADAARWVAANTNDNDWIPGPVERGAPIPLSGSELSELYATNGQLSIDEEQQIEARLPALSDVPTSDVLRHLLGAAAFAEPTEYAAFWSRPAMESERPAVERLDALARSIAEELNQKVPWQRRLIEAGYNGGTDRELWLELSNRIAEAKDVSQQGRRSQIEHAPAIAPGFSREEARVAAAELAAHLGSGGSLGWLSLVSRPRWRALLSAVTVAGVQPTEPEHFSAIGAVATTEITRSKLAARWGRQAEPIGLPSWHSLGREPESVLAEYAQQFEPLLDWWTQRRSKIQAAAKEAAFDWGTFRQREVARSGPATPFERDAQILAHSLASITGSRMAACDAERTRRRLAGLVTLLEGYHNDVCAALAAAIRRADVEAYEIAHTRLRHLIAKESIAARRRELLAALEQAADDWAEAIRQRTDPHGESALPGDAVIAWRWRQLRQEIDRRAALDEVALARQLERLRDELRRATATLIDRRAWLGQLRRTDLQSRQALQGWVDVQRKIGKGTGKRAPMLQAEARRLLTKARDAVPVWIMPLARVAESFDPRTARFDVVIVDEASQSDPTGLLSWYLGDRIAVVGDHQQVSPLAVGQQLDVIQALISEHLVGIPNALLYDGATSIYDLARQSFGGTIALREHFRCVPDIIEFSNRLSYDGEIRPLRDPTTANRPHVVEYCVDAAGAATRSGKTNLAEARVIAALVKSICEMEEYRGKSAGAITLLGDEQADLIQDLTVRLVGAVELERMRFAAGNSAQFQGDERDIVFLSMVDAPTGSLLALRQMEMYKQRYNVAASRAKDQLWLVHSLDPARDLKQGDLRRRLIEHVRDPQAQRRAIESAQSRAESPFERAVIEHLVGAGYRIEPQVWVGRYRIDMVVSTSMNRVAVECDGDRYHGLEQIPEDMVRQAILERAGWRFIRLRGTRYFRDPSGTMTWVMDQLHRLGVEPEETQGLTTPLAPGEKLRERVVRRAHEIMRENEWLQPLTNEANAPAGT